MSMLGSFLAMTMLDEAARLQREQELRVAADGKMLLAWLRSRPSPPRLKDLAQRAPLPLRDRDRRFKALAWLVQRGQVRREQRGQATVLVLP